MRKISPWASGFATGKKVTVLFVLFLSTLAAASYADSPATPPAPSGYHYLSQMELPFSKSPGYNLPVAQFKINGTFVVNLAMDTGAPANMIPEGIVKKLGLVPRPYLVNGQPYLFAGKPASYVQVGSLSASAYNFPDFSFLAVDDKYFSSLAPYGIDGIIGLGMLGTNAVFIDYGQRMIAFFGSSRLTRQHRTFLGFKEDPIPMTVSKVGYYEVPVEVHNGAQSTREEMTIDTGDAVSSLSRQVADQLHLKRRGHLEVPRPFEGNISVSIVGPDSLKFGNALATGGEILCQDKDTPMSFPLLGDDLLSNCRVLLDFPAKMMYLAPLTDPSVDNTPFVARLVNIKPWMVKFVGDSDITSVDPAPPAK